MEMKCVSLHLLQNSFDVTFYLTIVGTLNCSNLSSWIQDDLLASIAESEKQTELAVRVSTWKQRIEENLEEQVRAIIINLLSHIQNLTILAWASCGFELMLYLLLTGFTRTIWYSWIWWKSLGEAVDGRTQWKYHRVICRSCKGARETRCCSNFFFSSATGNFLVFWQGTLKKLI